MASGSDTAAKLAELKKDVVTILNSCEGHRLDLGRFKEEYKKTFRKPFDKKYVIFKKGWRLKTLMAELDDVIDLEESASVVVMKLKELYSASRDSKSKDNLTSQDTLEASAGFQQVNSDSPAKSPLSQAKDKESKTATTAKMSSPNNDSSNVSGRTFLKAQRRLKKKSTESKEKDHEPTGENVAALISPSTSSSPETSALFSGASCLGLPLSPPPVSRLDASGISRNRKYYLRFVCSGSLEEQKSTTIIYHIFQTPRRHLKIQGSVEYISGQTLRCSETWFKYGLRQCLI